MLTTDNESKNKNKKILRLKSIVNFKKGILKKKLKLQGNQKPFSSLSYVTCNMPVAKRHSKPFTLCNLSLTIKPKHYASAIQLLQYAYCNMPLALCHLHYVHCNMLNEKCYHYATCIKELMGSKEKSSTLKSFRTLISSETKH